MDRWQLNQKPVFVWQGILIILPILILVSLGLLSLRQDKALATQEAKDRGQVLTDELSRQIWNKLDAQEDFSLNSQRMTNGLGNSLVCFLQVNAQGVLIFPPPFHGAPDPMPFDLSELNDRQLQSWRAACGAEFNSYDFNPSALLWEEFLKTEPPARFQASAQFALALDSAKQGKQDIAKKVFLQIAQGTAETIAESGLPFKLLADIQLLQATHDRMTSTNKDTAIGKDSASQTDSRALLSEDGSALDFDSICADAMRYPTLLTPRILDLAKQWRNRTMGSPPKDTWQSVWENHEMARRIYRTLVGEGQSNWVIGHPFWLNADEPWLAIPHSESSTTALVWWVCRPAQEVRKMIRGTMSEIRTIPEYMSIKVELAGKSIFSITNATDERLDRIKRIGGIPSPLIQTSDPKFLTLASTSRMDNEKTLLKVVAELALPDLLYARQRTRTFWFGSLIAMAAASSCLGLLAAWRASQRQLRLIEMKSNFVSSVTHELRAPIASVTLLVERLESGRVTTEEKKAEYFRFIRQECRRLSALIGNVLDFSRIDQGRKQYHFEMADLLAMSRQTTQLLEPFVGERQVTLALKISDDHEKSFDINCDAQAMQQALINLIDNAVKHSPANGTVTVGLEDRGQEVHLWVEDQGPGIPVEEHERIFEQFYRRGSELRRESPGIGIGLTLVKHIMLAHRGKVLVRSEVGKGSRFTLVLPKNESSGE